MDGGLASEQVRKSQIFTTEARRHGEEREDWVILKPGIVTVARRDDEHFENGLSKSICSAVFGCQDGLSRFPTSA
jgi:hypothetical protein